MREGLRPVLHQILDLGAPAGGSAFSPALFQSAAGLNCIYRRVGEDGASRLWRCRLDQNFRALDAHCWSDELTARDGVPLWQADPRAFFFKGRWHIAFNTGDSQTSNQIYLVEVDDDGLPAGPAKPVWRGDGRPASEKAFGFFASGDALFCVYSVSPFVVLRVDIGADAAVAQPFAVHHWHAAETERAFGDIQCGSSPLLANGKFFLVTQSCMRTRGAPEYNASLLTFEALQPFRPLMMAPRPLFQLFAEEQAFRLPLHSQINPGLHPSGTCISPDGRDMDLGYGINNLRAGLRRYAVSELEAALLPVVGKGTVAEPDARPASALRTYFWEAPRSTTPKSGLLTRWHRFRFGNAGDSLQSLITTRLFGAEGINVEGENGRLLCMGSIAQRARPGDIIWGCGSKPVPPDFSQQDAQSITALVVRGPLTRDYLARAGVNVDRITQFFDPGLLLTQFFPAEIAALRNRSKPARGVLYMPHFRDAKRFQALYPGARIGSMDAPLMEIVEQVLGAELVVASSLHGLIFAESLGVPALMHRASRKETFTKYQDYYLGSGRETFPVLDEGESPGGRLPPQLPAIPADWRATLPGAQLLAGIGMQLDYLEWGKSLDMIPQSVQPGVSECAIDVSLCHDAFMALQLAARDGEIAQVAVLAGQDMVATRRVRRASDLAEPFQIDLRKREPVIRIRLWGAATTLQVRQLPSCDGLVGNTGILAG